MEILSAPIRTNSLGATGCGESDLHPSNSRASGNPGNNLSTEMASVGVCGEGTTQESGLHSPNGRLSGTSSFQVLGQALCCCGDCTFPSRGTTPSCLTSGSTSIPQASRCCGCFKLSSTNSASNNDTGYSGSERFKVRELSDAEKYHLNKGQNDPFLQKLICSRVFADPAARMKHWPRYFENSEDSGEDLRAGYVILWSTFILAESLLASVSIQPFISIGGSLTGWRFEVYGLVWMLALVIDMMGLGVTALFLGHLYGNPAKLTYMWVCNIGVWIGVPATLVLGGTITSLVAIAYSTWVIYGQRLGIICTIIEVLVIAFAIRTSTSLGNAGREVEALE